MVFDLSAEDGPVVKRLQHGVTVFNHGKHNLQVGVEYAPAFTDLVGTINNIGFTFGYQFL